MLFATPATSQTTCDDASQTCVLKGNECAPPDVCASEASLNETVRLECGEAERKAGEYETCTAELTTVQREKWKGEGKIGLLVSLANKADTVLWGARAENLRLKSANERLATKAGRWWMWGLGGLLAGMFVVLGGIAYAKQ